MDYRAPDYRAPQPDYRNAFANPSTNFSISPASGSNSSPHNNVAQSPFGRAFPSMMAPEPSFPESMRARSERAQHVVQALPDQQYRVRL
jgi:hypothetical protein